MNQTLKKPSAHGAITIVTIFILFTTLLGVYGLSTLGKNHNPSLASGEISTSGAIYINRSFGMIGHGWGYDPTDAADMAAAGMELNRADFTWSSIEQVLGVYDFTWYDTLYSNLAGVGVDILALLDYGNAALFGPFEALRIVTTEQINAWLAFVDATVRHFPGIRNWEIWNEPNLDCFWNGTDDQFFKLLNATAALIHSIDPTLMLVSAGISGYDPDYLDRMISYIGDDHFSEWFGALGFHPYSGSDAEVVATSIQAVQAVCSQHHFYGEVWITEWGYSTTRNPAYIAQDFILQGSLLCKVYALSLARNISQVMWYSFKEDGFGTQYNQSAGYNTPGSTGGNVMNAAGHAFATLSSLLTNSTYLPAAITLEASFVPSSQLWAYAFLTARGHLVLIAWNSLGPYTLSFSSLSTITTAWQFDPLTGTNKTMSLGAFSVDLGIETPIIIEVEFLGTPGVLTVQIMPTIYSAMVLFAFPALFAVGIAVCVWTALKGKRVSRK